MSDTWEDQKAVLWAELADLRLRVERLEAERMTGRGKVIISGPEAWGVLKDWQGSYGGTVPVSITYGDGSDGSGPKHE
jgi:hypothetical protein